MNILYLCPNFPPNYYPFCVHLKKAGATVAGIGWESYDKLRPELKDSLTEYCHVPDMGNYEHVHRAAAYLLSRVGRFDRIVSQEEHWIDLEAVLRLDFNVSGKNSDEIRDSRHKSLMKKVYRNAGIPVAAGELASDTLAARQLIERVGFPIIAKPDKGVGACATYKIHDEAELEEFFLRKSRETPYILEEFMEGHIESFDGLTGKDGSIVFYTAHRFGNDIMTTVNNDDHVHYWSLREIPEDLEDYGRRSVAAFDVRERFFHLEFIRSPEGELRAMEANIRPPGGLTTDMFNYANDIDVYKAWADIVVSGSCRISAERPYHVCYIGRKSSKNYSHSNEEILRKYGPAIMVNTPIDSVFRRAIGDYAYLVRSPHLEDIWPIVDFIHSQDV